MRIGDIFSLLAAALIGLLILVLKAWSPQWWGAVIVVGVLTAGTGLHILWSNLPVSIKTAIAPVIWKPTGYLRSWIGILLLCILMGGSYIASHFPIDFLRSAPGSPAIPEPTGPIISRLNHFILACDVAPPPPESLTDLLWQLQDYKQKLDILGDALGIAFTMETIRGGVRIEAEAVTDEAKQRIPSLSSMGVTKFTFELRRVEKNEIVSVIVKLPPQLAFNAWIPPNPAAPDTILLIGWVERFFSFKPGACRLL
jgi:hypothetical protein